MLNRCSERHCFRLAVAVGMCSRCLKKHRFRPGGTTERDEAEAKRVNMFHATDGDCVRTSYPCDATACRFHLSEIRSVQARARQIVGDTCSLRVAHIQGPMTLEETGDRMGLTRERIRQIESGAKRKMRIGLAARGFAVHDVDALLSYLGDISAR